MSIRGMQRVSAVLSNAVFSEDSYKPWTHRGVLALYAGAVKAQGSDTGGTARDMEDALIIALSGLRLRQVFGSQGDGFHHTHRDIYLG